MRISISNIAWDVDQDDAVAELLKKHSVDAIDVAPGKYFPDPENATLSEIRAVKEFWCARGVDVVGMQALLFGAVGLNLFGATELRKAMLKRLTAVCRIGSELGALRLVFGSPKNRDRSGLSDEQSAEIAIPFFRKLGDIAAQSGVKVCLEPNPPCYGANFMVDSAETQAIVAAVNHSHIGMQLDTGAMCINRENVDLISTYAPFIAHIHLSEPQLVTLGEGGVDHKLLGECLPEIFPNHIATIEMLPAKNRSNLEAIDSALGIAVTHYRKS